MDQYTGTQAAKLHAAFVRQTAEMLLSFSGRASIELHSDEDWTMNGFGAFRQSQGTLGERMLDAIEGGLRRGSPVLVLGSDAPSLPPSHVEALLASSCDVAIGPADDGGYWGIACRSVHPEMFRGVEWSTRRAFDQTVRAVQAAGLSLEIGPTWFDVDTAGDLDRLVQQDTRWSAILESIMSKTLEAGDPAPDIELATETGERVKLSDFRGKTVVLFFYPKADTPGCTREACSFRDAITDYSNRDTVVLGISPDKPASQAKFKKKYELPYQLLADENKEAAQAFGVWAEKSFLGKKYMGVERTTFVIGPDGNIAKVFRKVKPAGHAAEVLSSLA